MLFAADTSYYQPQVDNSYTRQWLIFRGCDGDFLDPVAVGNADWCRGAVAQGLMLGFTVYVVYRPGMNGAILRNLALLGPVDRVMVDVEAWGSQIQGDHSDDINSLVLDLGAIVGQSHVWVYANLADENSIYPRRLPGQLMVVPSWGTNKPNVPNLIGWQYTQGQTASGDRPLSSAPFGACDHNELYVDELSPSGGGIQEDDMGDLQNDVYQFEDLGGLTIPDMLAEIRKAVGRVWTDPQTIDPYGQLTPAQMLGQIRLNEGGAVDIDALAAAIVAKLPPTATGPTANDIAKEFARLLGAS